MSESKEKVLVKKISAILELPISSKYTLGTQIGTGNFATVREGKLVTGAKGPGDGKDYAVKTLRKSAMKKPTSAEHFRQEITTLMTLRGHPNIIALYEVYEDPEDFHMVMELVTGGELFDRIVEKHFYSENEARVALKQLVSALSYCHGLGIAHRDIKPENLMYFNKAEDAVLKLVDFGFAYQLDYAHGESMRSMLGTPGYIAPEILKKQPYTRAVDVWSTGVVAFVCLCGYPPFYDQNTQAEYRKIMKGQYKFQEEFGVMFKEGRSFVSRC